MKNFSFIIEKLKLNKDKPLLRSVSLLLATFLLLSVAVWAWFSMNETADADGLNITMGTSKNLLISLNRGGESGNDYFTGIDLLADGMQQYISEDNRIKDKLNMLDITSDGKTFYRPVFTQESNIRIPDCTQTWSTPNKNVAYISEYISFRTTFPAEIYMGAGTNIITECEQKGNELIGSSASNKSAVGDFSRDCIVGALRISAMDIKGNRLFTMIPRSDVELVKDDNGYSVKTGNPASQNAKEHIYYASDYLTKKATTTLKENVLTEFTATAESKPESGTTKLADTTYNATTGYYEGNATINIWLEGCDPETLRALSGGKYAITLDFVAYDMSETTNSSAAGE